MSHCYSMGVNIDGAEKEICTLVPGNEDLAKRVRDAEQAGGAKPKVSPEEVSRAVDFHLKRHREADHPKVPNGMIDMMRELPP